MILNLFVIWSFSPFHGLFQFILFLSLQDFTVLPTEIFRQYVIKSLSIIYFYRRPYRQNTSVCNTTIHHYIGRQHKKKHLPMVLQTEIARKKKIFRLKYTNGFIPSVIVWYIDGYISLVKLSVSVWNTDRRYPFVHSSVIVAGTVKYRRIKSVGKVVGECEIPTEYIRL
jgi:hypothetical protein